ncbi:MAG TPA: CPBP family intramembrane glutamic endopeptidase [Ktedonobacterales bacterium]|jgi:membrane protease YdiL (CAAX protease family)|nr:CPBP family intramembrane glutamic endopeptidase [Ktedonobacterales bacterium]
MSSVPRRIITIIWTGALAFVVTALVGGAWTAALAVNLAVSPAIPWSVFAMAVLLWALWRYLGGSWSPARTASIRRRYLRAKPVEGRTLAWALAAGLLSIVALAGLWIVLFQIARLPARALPDTSHYPLITVALALMMASLVNAVAEEALFRGYFQGALERQVGGLAAIIITILLMAPEHALTQGFVWSTLLFYIAVDAMLGTLAYLCQSIIPGIIVHAAGLLVFFTLVWPGDILRQIFGQANADVWLWIHSAQVIVFAALAVVAFIRLARWSRPLRLAEPMPVSLTTS